MKQSISCITPRGNVYTINKDKKLLYLTHPKLASALYGIDKSQDTDDYYIRKARYFKKYGLLDGTERQYDGVITPAMVRSSIGNLNQLVFEVTDACNLQCKYCGYRELYWNPQFIIGDIYSQKITEIWNSERALQLAFPEQKAFREVSPCKKCSLFEEYYSFPNKYIVDVLKGYGYENIDYPDPRCAKAPNLIII